MKSFCFSVIIIAPISKSKCTGSTVLWHQSSFQTFYPVSLETALDKDSVKS